MAEINLKDKLVTKKERVLSTTGTEALYSGKGIAKNSNNTTVPTTQAVKEYVDSNIYNHPTQSIITGKPTENTAPDFGGLVTVPQIKVNKYGHVTEVIDQDITIPSTIASATKNGLMSKADWSKLNGIPADANHYDHPTHTAYIGEPTKNQVPDFGGKANVSQFKVNKYGHVTDKTDWTITIPNTKAQPIIKNSSGTVTSQGNDGLMSIADKTKLDQIKSLEWTEIALKTAGSDLVQGSDFNKDNACIYYNGYIAFLELNFDGNFQAHNPKWKLPAKEWYELGSLPDGVPKPRVPVGTIITYGKQIRMEAKVEPSGRVFLRCIDGIDNTQITATLTWRVI